MPPAQDHEAGGHGIDRRWTRTTEAMVVVPVVVWLLLGAAAAWWPSGYYFVVAEDRPFEWIQVGGFAVTAAALLVVAVSLRGTNPATAVAAAIGGVLFVFVVGEELAWGQRLFGVSVPVIEQANDQSDVSLHNLGVVFVLSQAGILGVAMVGLLSRPAARWLAGRRGLPTPWDLLPPPIVVPWFGLAAGFTAARLLWLTSPSHRVAKFSEIAELTLSLAAAVTTVKMARSAARRRRLVVSDGVQTVGKDPGAATS